MTYQEFKNQVLGRAYDLDGYYGAQCWDGAMYYLERLGYSRIHCSTSGYVKDIWNNRASNGILNFCDEVSVMQPGDIAVFFECSATPYSHIAIFDSDAGGGYGNFLGQNQGGANGAFNIVRLPYSATFATAFRPKCFSGGGSSSTTYDPSMLIPEIGVATFRNDIPITVHRDSPTGPAFGAMYKGEVQQYDYKLIGFGHRYISWKYDKDPSIRVFAAVSPTEARPAEGSDDQWATFSEVKEENPSVPVDPERPDEEPEKPDFTANVKHWGCDISEHQGDFDVSKYDFVIIRAAYGTNEDKYFLKNVEKCRNTNIPFGVYLYDYALNDEQALEQATFLYNLLKEHDIVPDLGIWFDMEDADGYKGKNGVMNKERCTNSCKIFCEYFKERRYYVGIYASESWFGTYIEELGYPKWIAAWISNDGNLNADRSELCDLYQYTSKPIDKDVLYVEFDKFKSDPTEEEEPEDKPDIPTFPQFDTEALNEYLKVWAEIGNRILGKK